MGFKEKIERFIDPHKRKLVGEVFNVGGKFKVK